MRKWEQIKQAYLKKYRELKETLEKLFGDHLPDGKPGANDMRALLEQLGQIILYGPPGTGKTREAKRLALTLLSDQESATEAAEQDIAKNLKEFEREGRFDLVVFHPAYEYEQFVGGITSSVTTAGQVVFQTSAGTFLRLCRVARKDGRPAVLVIDEINRGNLPKLLGELVYALEYRDQEVRLPFVCDGSSDLVIPKNLYIIATMNSADRSIGHIDVAIRRRFGLYHLPPSSHVVKQVWRKAGDAPYGEQLAGLMQRLNEKVAIGPDPNGAVELGVGHSYFLPAPDSSGEAAKEHVRRKWEYQVKPLLREYADLNPGTNYQEFLHHSLNQALGGL